jgi:DNA transposition AAA+ family ATPase
MLEEIAIAMGITDLHHTPSGVRRQIEHVMRGTSGLLVIDEAQYGSVDCFEALRSLYDHTGCGVAVMGNMLVHSKLTGGNTQRSQMDAAQRYSRIGAKLKINGCSEKDVNELLNVWGITRADVRGKLAGIANKPGGLRSVEKVMRQALLMQPEKALGDFTHDEIVLAWSKHGGGTE